MDTIVGKNLQRYGGQAATIYKTELQLFPKKCRVKLQKHLNHIAGLSSPTLKTGKTCKAVRAGIF
jgi:hypothetical protein